VIDIIGEYLRARVPCTISYSFRNPPTGRENVGISTSWNTWWNVVTLTAWFDNKNESVLVVERITRFRGWLGWLARKLKWSHVNVREYAMDIRDPKCFEVLNNIVSLRI
jgi:hypothetical protein